jgi:VIT1/CCC1 family predicted Fe2+/Mn2+ transporter
MPHFFKNNLFIKDIVLAGNDGLITTFAIVAGAIGASLSPAVIIILGFANLFADGLSMATGTYLGSKSALDAKSSLAMHRKNKRLSLQSGLVTFSAFSLTGVFPILPFLLNLPNPVLYSCLLVFITLSTIGVFRGIVSKQKIYQTTLENLLIGGTAALVAFFVGAVLEKWLVG